MKHLLIGLLALFALTFPVDAQSYGNKYFATPPTYIDGQGVYGSVDINGNTIIAGAAANDAAATGNPVQVGCVANSTVPNAVTAGDAASVFCTTSGSLITSNGGPAFTGADGLSNANVVSSVSVNAGANLALRVGPAIAPYSFNGTSWDREFTCTQSAVVNVAAAASAQLVALSGSTIVRVCSFVLSADTIATTATFNYGTGATCGTGTTALTGAMRLQDEGNIAMSAGDGSLFRTAAGNALCISAVTGAVTGFITYAQF